MKNGWKPRRTIVYASWDAEEYGLVGSTEWAEEHAKEVDEKAVLMLNVDSAVSGRELEMSGVPSLRDLTLDAAGAITDPRTGKSLRDVWTAAHAPGLGRHRASVSVPIRSGKDRRRIGRDFFQPAPRSLRPPDELARLGLGLYGVRRSPRRAGRRRRFQGGATASITRSTTTSTGWSKFGDPEFLSHTPAARLYTLIVMRAAAADVVPLDLPPTAWPCANTSTSLD